MNYLDFIVVIPVLWGMFKGFKNGLISEVGAVVSLIAGIWLAIKFSAQVGEFIASKTSITPQYQGIVAFALIFFVVVVLCFIITHILKSLFKAIRLAWLDKLLGTVFGAAKWVIIIAFIFFFSNTLIVRYYNEPIEVLETSLFFKPLATAAHNLLENGIQLPDSEQISKQLSGFNSKTQ
ncbi:MAG: CvpA family protein [Bacteroidales bacterium]|jgi:membrane protein required for colicin V production|nr:CvpA family protein [Bacteroidales bacterium]